MRTHYTFDADLLLKDAGLVAASAAAQVLSADKILDLGLGVVEGNVVVDVTAIEVASGDEGYTIGWQLSNSPTFASVFHEASALKLGDSSIVGGDTDTPFGRYILPVRNEFNGTVYRYARLFTTVVGAIATGINYTAYLGKD